MHIDECCVTQKVRSSAPSRIRRTLKESRAPRRLSPSRLAAPATARHLVPSSHPTSVPSPPSRPVPFRAADSPCRSVYVVVMQTPASSSRRRRRPAILQRVSNILTRRFSAPLPSKAAPPQHSIESLTPTDTPGTPQRRITHHRNKPSSSSHVSTSPLTASPASVASRAPDRQRDPSPSCAHRADRCSARRRLSARFSARTLSRLDAMRSNIVEKKRAKSLMGCECEAAQERDVLSTRLGELAMTEMENESLRAQVDDLHRAMESVRKQAQDEVDCLMLEMQVLKKRARLEEGDFVEYSDDEDPHDVGQYPDTMAALWLGERALDVAEVAARLEWHD
ncbi:hypothetical protein FGB62_3g013 [Gracilaria domingensis]|nr:hypothetical protein FGB62_3g013 [Gracilaria domingensis]